MALLRSISQWLAWRRARRRARRRWRDLKIILVLVLLCLLFQVVSLGCGVVGYTLQRLGLLPTVTPSPPNSEVFFYHTPVFAPQYAFHHQPGEFPVVSRLTWHASLVAV